jgi:hypothetical protein
MKQCIKCKEWKSLDLFNTRTFGPNKKTCPRSICKKCKNAHAIQWRKDHHEKSSQWYRSRNLKKKYGITIDDYENMLREQKNKCAICKKIPKDFKYKFGVDHNHKTGKIRGLLCTKCNTAIGKLDSKKLLRSAIRYFGKYGE